MPTHPRETSHLVHPPVGAGTRLSIQGVFVDSGTWPKGSTVRNLDRTLHRPRRISFNLPSSSLRPQNPPHHPSALSITSPVSVPACPHGMVCCMGSYLARGGPAWHPFTACRSGLGIQYLALISAPKATWRTASVAVLLAVPAVSTSIPRVTIVGFT